MTRTRSTMSSGGRWWTGLPNAAVYWAGLCVSLGACKPKVEPLILPKALVEHVRLGMSDDDLAAARPEAARVECADAGGTCRAEKIADVDAIGSQDVLVTYRIVEGKLASVSIIETTPAGKPGHAKAQIARVNSALSEVPVQVELTTERGTHAGWLAAHFESKAGAVHVRSGVIDSFFLGDVFHAPIGRGPFYVTERRLFAPQHVPAPEGDPATSEDAASSVVDEAAARAVEVAHVVEDIGQQRLSSPADCWPVERLLGVPRDLCGPLVRVMQAGRTTREDREALRAPMQAQGYTELTGYIVAKVDDGLYEIAKLRWTGWGWAPAGGNHALLRTTVTSYSSKGRFTLWVKQVGTRPIETKDGFEQEWEVLEEDALGTTIRGIFDAPAGDATSAAARTALLALARANVQ